MSHGVICNLISGDVPIGDHGIVGIIEGYKVGHFGRTTVWVFPLSEELVDGVDGIGLNGVIGGEEDELRDILGIQTAGWRGGSTLTRG